MQSTSKNHRHHFLNFRVPWIELTLLLIAGTIWIIPTPDDIDSIAFICMIPLLFCSISSGIFLNLKMGHTVLISLGLGVSLIIIAVTINGWMSDELAVLEVVLGFGGFGVLISAALLGIRQFFATGGQKNL